MVDAYMRQWSVNRVDRRGWREWHRRPLGRRLGTEMHALGKFIVERMPADMTQAQLARKSGLSKQHISVLLKPDATRLGRMIDAKTVAGLSVGLNVDESVIVSKAAESMGIPLDKLRPVIVTADDVSDEHLLEILRQRLKGVGRVEDPAPIARAGGSPADGAVRWT